MMTKSDVTAMIRAKKRETGITWAAIAEATGLGEVFVTSACLGMNSLLPVRFTCAPGFKTGEISD